MELLSRGSTPTEADRVVVSVVLKPAPERMVEVHYDERERLPMGLYRLLEALLQDTNSLLRSGGFFGTLDRSYPLGRVIRPSRDALLSYRYTYTGPVYVKLCEVDGRYRVLCPLVPIGLDSSGAKLYFAGAVIVTAMALIFLCTCVWRLDMDSPPKSGGSGKRAKYRVTNGTSWDLGYLDPSMRSEFARSWLEGRLMDDEAAVRRKEKRARRRREEKARKSAGPSMCCL